MTMIFSQDQLEQEVLNGSYFWSPRPSTGDATSDRWRCSRMFLSPGNQSIKDQKEI